MPSPTFLIEEDPKFTFKKLPESYHEYPDAREVVKSKVLSCGLPIREVKYLLGLGDNKTLRVGQTERLMSTTGLEPLNSKLYNELRDSIQGKLSHHVRSIRDSVEFADGLSALLCRDEIIRHEGALPGN